MVKVVTNILPVRSYPLKSRLRLLSLSLLLSSPPLFSELYGLYPPLGSLFISLQPVPLPSVRRCEIDLGCNKSAVDRSAAEGTTGRVYASFNRRRRRRRRLETYNEVRQTSVSTSFADSDRHGNTSLPSLHVTNLLLLPLRH